MNTLTLRLLVALLAGPPLFLFILALAIGLSVSVNSFITSIVLNTINALSSFLTHCSTSCRLGASVQMVGTWEELRQPSPVSDVSHGTDSTELFTLSHQIGLYPRTLSTNTYNHNILNQKRTYIIQMTFCKKKAESLRAG